MSLDLILNHESSETLMVENLSNLPLVEPEVAVSNVAEADNANKDQHVRIITVAGSFKRIVTQLVAVGLVVHVVLFLKSVSMGVARENLLGAAKQKNALTTEHTYVCPRNCGD